MDFPEISEEKAEIIKINQGIPFFVLSKKYEMLLF